MSPGKGQQTEMEAQFLRKIKKVMDLLRVNWWTMAEFEILYKVLSLTHIYAVFSVGIQWDYESNGISISDDRKCLFLFPKSTDSSGVSLDDGLHGCLFYG